MFQNNLNFKELIKYELIETDQFQAYQIPIAIEEKALDVFNQEKNTYFSSDGQYYAILQQTTNQVSIHELPPQREVQHINQILMQKISSCQFTQDNKYFLCYQSRMTDIDIYFHDLVENKGKYFILSNSKLLKVWTTSDNKLRLLMTKFIEPIWQLYSIDKNFNINLIKQTQNWPNIFFNIIDSQSNFILANITEFRVFQKHSLKFVTNKKFFQIQDLSVHLNKFIFIKHFKVIQKTYMSQISNFKNIRIIKEKYIYFVFLRNWLIMNSQNSLIFYDFAKGQIIHSQSIQIGTPITGMFILGNHLTLKMRDKYVGWLIKS